MSNGRWSPPAIACIIKAAESFGKPVTLHLDKGGYNDLRFWGRDATGQDIVDHYDDYASLKMGLMAKVYGVDVWIDRSCAANTVAIRNEAGKDLAHAWKDDVVHPGALIQCPDPECVVRYVMTG